MVSIPTIVMVTATSALGAACNRAALGRPLYVVAAVKCLIVAQSLLVERALIDALRFRSLKTSVSIRLKLAALSHPKNEGNCPSVTRCGFPVRPLVRPPVPLHLRPDDFEPSGKCREETPSVSGRRERRIRKAHNLIHPTRLLLPDPIDRALRGTRKIQNTPSDRSMANTRGSMASLNRLARCSGQYAERERSFCSQRYRAHSVILWRPAGAQ
jgi:hypothetical protein